MEIYELCGERCCRGFWIGGRFNSQWSRSPGKTVLAGSELRPIYTVTCGPFPPHPRRRGVVHLRRARRLSITSSYVAKVGSDFAYGINHDPIVSSSSPTTLFHAHFSSEPAETRRQDGILKRVYSYEPISPSELPDSRFDFGMAVEVAGEILPETLERMIDVCNVVFVDIQALIREFDSVDGSVKLVGLKERGLELSFTQVVGLIGVNSLLLRLSQHIHKLVRHFAAASNNTRKGPATMILCFHSCSAG